MESVGEEIAFAVRPTGIVDGREVFELDCASCEKVFAFEKGIVE